MLKPLGSHILRTLGHNLLEFGRSLISASDKKSESDSAAKFAKSSFELDSNTTNNPFICANPNAHTSNRAKMFGNNPHQSLLDCGYNLQDASRYADLIKAFSDSGEKVFIRHPRIMAIMADLVAPQIAKNALSMVKELESFYKNEMYDELMRDALLERMSVYKGGLSLTRDLALQNAASLEQAADDLLVTIGIKKAQLEVLARDKKVKYEDVLRQQREVEAWVNAINIYGMIKNAANLPRDGSVVKEVRFGLVKALATGDVDEIRKASRVAKKLLAIGELLSTKAEMVSHSSAPVKIGHIPFKFYYENAGEDSLVPHDELNNTTVSLEFAEIGTTDPVRAIELTRYLHKIDAVEKFIKTGAVTRDLEAGSMDLSEILEKAFMDSANLMREAKVSDFLQALKIRDTLKTMEAASNPNSETGKKMSLAKSGGELMNLAGLAEDLSAYKINDLGIDLVALESLKDGLVTQLKKESEWLNGIEDDLRKTLNSLDRIHPDTRDADKISGIISLKLSLSSALEEQQSRANELRKRLENAIDSLETSPPIMESPAEISESHREGSLDYVVICNQYLDAIHQAIDVSREIGTMKWRKAALDISEYNWNPLKSNLRRRVSDESYSHIFNRADIAIREFEAMSSGHVDSDESYAAYVNEVSRLSIEGNSEEELATAIESFERHGRVQKMTRSIDEQLFMMGQILGTIEANDETRSRVSSQYRYAGIDHKAPIDYTVQLLKLAKRELAIGNEEAAEAYFVEAVMSPNFEYVQRIAETEGSALAITEIYNTAKEVAITVLAGYVAMGFETVAAVTRVGTMWRRVKDVYNTARAVRKTNDIRTLAIDIARAAGNFIVEGGPKAVRFATHSLGFHLGSAFLHNGTKGIWDSRLSTADNLIGHGLGTAEMMWILLSIGGGTRIVDSVISRMVFTERAVANLAAAGRIITKEAVTAEVQVIKAGLKGFEKWAYHGAMIGGEFGAFTFAEGSLLGMTEAYHKGISNIDWDLVYQSTASWEANKHRAEFLAGLKIFHATLGKPISEKLNSAARERIYEAHKEIFNEYRSRAEAAVDKLNILTKSSPDKWTDRKLKLWIRKLREALEARIALKEQLPKFVQDGSLIEERAALAELKEIEKGSYMGGGVYRVDSGFAVTPAMYMDVVQRAVIDPKLQAQIKESVIGKMDWVLFDDEVAELQKTKDVSTMHAKLAEFIKPTPEAQLPVSGWELVDRVMDADHLLRYLTFITERRLLWVSNEQLIQLRYRLISSDPAEIAYKANYEDGRETDQTTLMKFFVSDGKMRGGLREVVQALKVLKVHLDSAIPMSGFEASRAIKELGTYLSVYEKTPLVGNENSQVAQLFTLSDIWKLDDRSQEIQPLVVADILGLRASEGVEGQNYNLSKKEILLKAADAFGNIRRIYNVNLVDIRADELSEVRNALISEASPALLDAIAKIDPKSEDAKLILEKLLIFVTRTRLVELTDRVAKWRLVKDPFRKEINAIDEEYSGKFAETPFYLSAALVDGLAERAIGEKEGLFSLLVRMSALPMSITSPFDVDSTSIQHMKASSRGRKTAEKLINEDIIPETLTVIERVYSFSLSPDERGSVTAGLYARLVELSAAEILAVYKMSPLARLEFFEKMSFVDPLQIANSRYGPKKPGGNGPAQLALIKDEPSSDDDNGPLVASPLQSVLKFAGEFLEKGSKLDRPEDLPVPVPYTGEKSGRVYLDGTKDGGEDPSVKRGGSIDALLVAGDKNGNGTGASGEYRERVNIKGIESSSEEVGLIKIYTKAVLGQAGYDAKASFPLFDYVILRHDPSESKEDVYYVVEVPKDLDMSNTEKMDEWISTIVKKFAQVSELFNEQAEEYVAQKGFVFPFKLKVVVPDELIDHANDMFDRFYAELQSLARLGKTAISSPTLDLKNYRGTAADYDSDVRPAVNAIYPRIREIHSFLKSAFDMVLQSQNADASGKLRFTRGVHNINNDLTPTFGYVELYPSEVSEGRPIDLTLLFPVIDDVGSVVERTCSLYKSVAKDADVDLKIEILPELFKIKLSSGEISDLRGMMNNIVSNAVKYHNDELEKGQRAVVVRADLGKDGEVVVDVIDNGLGMTAETVGSIGRAHFRAEDVKDVRPGTGLGLVDVFEKINDLNGVLTVTSTKDGITTVRTISNLSDEIDTQKTDNPNGSRFVIKIPNGSKVPIEPEDVQVHKDGPTINDDAAKTDSSKLSMAPGEENRVRDPLIVEAISVIRKIAEGDDGMLSQLFGWMTEPLKRAKLIMALVTSGEPLSKEEQLRHGDFILLDNKGHNPPVTTAVVTRIEGDDVYVAIHEPRTTFSAKEVALKSLPDWIGERRAFRIAREGDNFLYARSMAIAERRFQKLDTPLPMKFLDSGRKIPDSEMLNMERQKYAVIGGGGKIISEGSVYDMCYDWVSDKMGWTESEPVFAKLLKEADLVDPSNVKEGDIVIYMKDETDTAHKVDYGTSLGNYSYRAPDHTYRIVNGRVLGMKHIGIVKHVSGDDITVVSKWGGGPVYEHPLDVIAAKWGDRAIFFRMRGERKEIEPFELWVEPETPAGDKVSDAKTSTNQTLSPIAVFRKLPSNHSGPERLHESLKNAGVSDVEISMILPVAKLVSGDKLTAVCEETARIVNELKDIGFPAEKIATLFFGIFLYSKSEKIDPLRLLRDYNQKIVSGRVSLENGIDPSPSELPIVLPVPDSTVANRGEGYRHNVDADSVGISLPGSQKTLVANLNVCLAVVATRETDAGTKNVVVHFLPSGPAHRILAVNDPDRIEYGRYTEWFHLNRIPINSEISKQAYLAFMLKALEGETWDITIVRGPNRSNIDNSIVESDIYNHLTGNHEFGNKPNYSEDNTIEFSSGANIFITPDGRLNGIGGLVSAPWLNPSETVTKVFNDSDNRYNPYSEGGIPDWPRIKRVRWRQITRDTRGYIATLVPSDQQLIDPVALRQEMLKLLRDGPMGIPKGDIQAVVGRLILLAKDRELVFEEQWLALKTKYELMCNDPHREYAVGNANKGEHVVFVGYGRDNGAGGRVVVTTPNTTIHSHGLFAKSVFPTLHDLGNMETGEYSFVDKLTEGRVVNKYGYEVAFFAKLSDRAALVRWLQAKNADTEKAGSDNNTVRDGIVVYALEEVNPVTKYNRVRRLFIPIEDLRSVVKHGSKTIKVWSSDTDEYVEVKLSRVGTTLEDVSALTVDVSDKGWSVPAIPWFKEWSSDDPFISLREVPSEKTPKKVGVIWHSTEDDEIRPLKRPLLDQIDWIRHVIQTRATQPGSGYEYVYVDLLKGLREQLIEDGVSPQDIRMAEMGYGNRLEVLDSLVTLSAHVSASEKDPELRRALEEKRELNIRGGSFEVVGDGEIRSGQHLVVLNMPPSQDAEAQRVVKEVEDITAVGGYYAVETDRPEIYIDRFRNNPEWELVADPIEIDGALSIFPTDTTRDNTLAIFRRRSVPQSDDFKKAIPASRAITDAKLNRDAISQSPHVRDLSKFGFSDEENEFMISLYNNLAHKSNPPVNMARLEIIEKMNLTTNPRSSNSEIPLMKSSAEFGSFLEKLRGSTKEEVMNVIVGLYDVVNPAIDFLVSTVANASDAQAVVRNVHKQSTRMFTRVRQIFYAAQKVAGKENIDAITLSLDEAIKDASGDLFALFLSCKDGSENSKALVSNFVKKRSDDKTYVGDLPEGRSYEVDKAREKLSEDLLAYLDLNKFRVGWIGDDLILVGSPEASKNRSKMGWPPDTTNNIYLKSVLAVLGWDLKVESLSEDQITIRLNFGKTLVDKPSNNLPPDSTMRTLENDAPRTEPVMYTKGSGGEEPRPLALLRQLSPSSSDSFVKRTADSIAKLVRSFDGLIPPTVVDEVKAREILDIFDAIVAIAYGSLREKLLTRAMQGLESDVAYVETKLSNAEAVKQYSDRTYRRNFTWRIITDAAGRFVNVTKTNDNLGASKVRAVKKTVHKKPISVSAPVAVSKPPKDKPGLSSRYYESLVRDVFGPMKRFQELLAAYPEVIKDVVKKGFRGDETAEHIVNRVLPLLMRGGVSPRTGLWGKELQFVFDLVGDVLRNNALARNAFYELQIELMKEKGPLPEWAKIERGESEDSSVLYLRKLFAYLEKLPEEKTETLRTALANIMEVALIDHLFMPFIPEDGENNPGGTPPPTIRAAGKDGDGAGTLIKMPRSEKSGDERNDASSALRSFMKKLGDAEWEEIISGIGEETFVNGRLGNVVGDHIRGNAVKIGEEIRDVASSPTSIQSILNSADKIGIPDLLDFEKLSKQDMKTVIVYVIESVNIYELGKRLKDEEQGMEWGRNLFKNYMKAAGMAIREIAPVDAVAQFQFNAMLGSLDTSDWRRIIKSLHVVLSGGRKAQQVQLTRLARDARIIEVALKNYESVPKETFIYSMIEALNVYLVFGNLLGAHFGDLAKDVLLGVVNPDPVVPIEANEIPLMGTDKEFSTFIEKLNTLTLNEAVAILNLLGIDDQLHFFQRYALAMQRAFNASEGFEEKKLAADMAERGIRLGAALLGVKAEGSIGNIVAGVQIATDGDATSVKISRLLLNMREMHRQTESDPTMRAAGYTNSPAAEDLISDHQLRNIIMDGEITDADGQTIRINPDSLITRIRSLPPEKLGQITTELFSASKMIVESFLEEMSTISKLDIEAISRISKNFQRVFEDMERVSKTVRDAYGSNMSPAFLKVLEAFEASYMEPFRALSANIGALKGWVAETGRRDVRCEKLIEAWYTHMHGVGEIVIDNRGYKLPMAKRELAKKALQWLGVEQILRIGQGAGSVKWAGDRLHVRMPKGVMPWLSKPRGKLPEESVLPWPPKPTDQVWSTLLEPLGWRLVPLKSEKEGEVAFQLGFGKSLYERDDKGGGGGGGGSSGRSVGIPIAIVHRSSDPIMRMAGKTDLKTSAVLTEFDKIDGEEVDFVVRGSEVDTVDDPNKASNVPDPEMKAARGKESTWEDVGIIVRNPAVVEARKKLSASIPKEWGDEIARFVENDITSYIQDLNNYGAMKTGALAKCSLYMAIFKSLKDSFKGFDIPTEQKSKIALETVRELKRRRVGTTKTVLEGERKRAWQTALRKIRETFNRELTLEEVTSAVSNYLGDEDMGKLRKTLPELYIGPFCEVACEKLITEDVHWQNEILKFAKRFAASVNQAEDMIPQVCGAFKLTNYLEELRQIVMESLIAKLKKGRTGDKVFAARELSLNWTRKKTGNENIKWEDVEKWKRIGFAKPKALDISHARISDLVVEVKEELKTGNEHHFEREIKANSDLLIKTNDLGWMIKYLSGISYKSADFDGVSKAEYLAQRFYGMIRWHKTVETNAYRELMREFEDGNTGILEKALIFINKCVENEFELARSADGDLDIVVKPPKKSEKLFSDISKDPFIQEAYASLILSMPNATQWKQELVQYIWIGIERIVKEQIRDYENPANEARVTREFASWLVFFSRAMERTIEEIDEGRVPVKRRYDVGKRVIERLIGEAIELSGGDDNGSGTPPASPGPENSARPVMPEGDVEANGLSGFETLIEKGFRALRANPFDPNTNAISPVAIAAMDRSTGEYTQPPRRRSGQFTPFRDLPLFKGKLTRKDAIDLLVQIVDERFDGDVSKMRSADGFALMRFFRCEDGNPISGLTLIKIVIPEIGIRYEKSKNNGNFHVAKAILRNAIIEVRQLVEKAKASNKPRKKFDLIENAKKKKGGPDSGGKTPPASGGAKTATEKSLAASDKIEKIYAEVEEVERQVVELLSEATSRMGSITKEMYESDGCQDELADIAVLTGSAMTIYEKYTQRLDQVEMENSAEKGIRYWEIRSRLHSIGNILNRVMSTPKDIISFHRKGEDYSFVEAILKEPLPSIEAHKKSHKFEMYGFLADNYNVKIKFVGSGEKILEAMPSWLKYIIENLIINTASKTPDGEQAKLFIDYNPETRTFAFTNSMPPIPKEIHIKMGREVMNGDFEKEGPGKGLFVNFNMAKLHGGKMWVDRGQEANPEKGITEKRPTFYIQLPSEDIEPESGDGGGTLPVAGSTTTPPVSAGFLRKAADNVLGGFLSEDRINDPHEAVYEKYGVRVTNKNNRVTVVTPNGTWHTGRRDDGRFHNNFPEELTRLSGLRGKKILDIGTGGGTLVTRLRKKGIDIEGLDMWLNEYQRRQKHFIEALAHDIPRPDETYDIVHVQEAMFRDSAEKSGHEENVATLREIKRVLKVGGRLRVAPVNVELLTGLVAEVGGLKILKPAKSVSTTAKPLYLEIEKMSNDEANSPDSGTTPPVSKDSSPKTGPVQGSLPAFFPQAFTTTLTAPGEGLFARPSLLVNGGINARGLSPRFDAKPRDDGWVDFEVGNGFADNSEVNVEYDATYRPGKTSGVMAAE